MRPVFLIFITLFIFTGSVFTTSSRFVNTTNTPKFYFVIVFLLCSIILLAFKTRRINLNFLFHKKILWGGYLVCIIQSCYGISQFLGWFPSNNSKFVITGSFDNPAGFVTGLAVFFPIGLFLIVGSKRTQRYIAVIGLVLIIISVFLSKSRTGVLAVLISFLIFFLFEGTIIHKFRKLRYHKVLLILFLTLFITEIFYLCYQKKDSISGRLLIWKISSIMIKDKPAIGHGFGGFKAKYMDYQADYFIKNPNSKFKLLADNVKHPFNEFIKITVEYGIIGLTTVFIIVLMGSTIKVRCNYCIFV